MIDGLEIENFQSHKKSSLTFHKGVNVIVGDSDSGKSGIMRSLLWGITNKPSGGGFVSHWAKNEKGHQNKPCSSKIYKDNRELVRIREKTSNQYKLEGVESFGAMRGDIPEQVAEFLNMSDVNIQHQHDRPFLLFETSGEVARVLNRVVKLDVIDKALSGIDGKKRTNKRELDVLEDAITDLNTEIAKFEKLPAFEELLIKYETADESRVNCANNTESLEANIAHCTTLTGELESLNEKAVNVALELAQARSEEIVEYIAADDDYKELEQMILSVQSSKALLVNADNIEGTIKITSDYQEALNTVHQSNEKIADLKYLITDLENYTSEVGQQRSLTYARNTAHMYDESKYYSMELSSRITYLQDLIKSYEDTHYLEKQLRIDANDLEQSMPDICPTCNRPLEDDKCNSQPQQTYT